ncbi:MAG: VWA domain-containing protein [Planctomycetes bacterium]|nr:VWA domain-containing protein [Planctomycetota bacterium]
MEITCLHCGQRAEATRELAGRTVECPHCGGQVKVPQGLFAADKGDKRRKLYEYAVSAASTLVIHAILLVILGLIYWGLTQGRGFEVGEVGIGQLPNEELTAHDDSQLEAGEEIAAAPAMELEDDFAEIATPVEPLDEGLAISPIVPSGGSKAGGAGGFDAGPAGGAAGFGLKAKFMNVEAEGRYFCIIADASTSMTGPKLEFVKAEIIETMSGLKTDARVYVIFFNHRAQPYPERRWLAKSERQSVKDWMQRQVVASGLTYPVDAFKIAMSLKPRPDVIFLMTDGEFNPPVPPVPPQIAALNAGSKKVTIHTIAFVDRVGEPELKQIAADSGNGTYRYVPGF